MELILKIILSAVAIYFAVGYTAAFSLIVMSLLCKVKITWGDVVRCLIVVPMMWPFMGCGHDEE